MTDTGRVQSLVHWHEEHHMIVFVSRPDCHITHIYIIHIYTCCLPLLLPSIRIMIQELQPSMIDSHVQIIFMQDLMLAECRISHTL